MADLPRVVEPHDVENQMPEISTFHNKSNLYGSQRSLSTSESKPKLNRNDPEMPQNWSVARKTYDTAVIVFLEFYTTIISTTGASAAQHASKDYNMGKFVSLIAFTTMYNLGQALGGLLMPPYSESFGRRNVYLASCAIFSLFSLLVGVVPHPAAIFIGRFFTGFASAVPSVVISGSVVDMYDVQRRIIIVLIWNIATSSALAIGPIYGSYIATSIGWRWIFYTGAIITGFNFVLLLGIKESRPVKLLSQRFDDTQKHRDGAPADISNPYLIKDVRTFFIVVLSRPLRCLFSEPIVMFVSIMSAISWSLIYLFTASFEYTYSSFGFSQRATSLPFIAVLLGTVLSILPRFYDTRVLRKRRESGKEIEPEDKIIGVTIAAPMLAVGLWIFSWTVPPVTNHWFPSMIGLVFVGFAAAEIANTLSGYLSDAYTTYAASALGGLAFLRAIASGFLPLLAGPLFGGLGTNVGGSIIAGIATAVCVLPWIFFKYGKWMRERSEFARFSTQLYRQMIAVDN